MADELESGADDLAAEIAEAAEKAMAEVTGTAANPLDDAFGPDAPGFSPRDPASDQWDPTGIDPKNLYDEIVNPLIRPGPDGTGVPDDGTRPSDEPAENIDPRID